MFSNYAVSTRVGMSIENSLLNKDGLQGPNRVAEALSYLKAARTLRRNRRALGGEHVELYYKDLDGDWLDKWAEEEAEDGEETESLSH
jgi:hypothetical protein